MKRAIRALGALTVAVGALSSSAGADTIRELVRFESDGTPPILQGFGLVVGLPGTGDSSKELAVARSLVQALAARGIVADPEEFGRGNSAALVSVTVRINGDSALRDDTFDVQVASFYSATSLEGGRLLMTPVGVVGPQDSGPYAIAEGAIDVDNPEAPTVGKVHRGAHMIRDFLAGPKLGPMFNLIVRPHFEGEKSASVIASTINQNYYGRLESDYSPVAKAIDARTIRITVPIEERDDIVGFVGDILSGELNPALLKLPARVIVNQASQTIVLTSDITITPGVISDSDLQISRVIPPPEPTPANPEVRQRSATDVHVGDIRPSQQARLKDLLEAFERLDLPIKKQIEVLSMLDRAGQLHAELIIE
jgi:flagellar P-ring protein precursor FlgI